ncbi:MAG: extradiol dioxygenase [Cryobacterium sp.]|jgi:predicted lactoylglutathione lyase|nr:extradiol dioxygenase [Cryobacterium sp.]
MSRMIFVNLPVANLKASKDFFTALGFSFDPKFTDENAACLIIDDGHIYAMLITPDHFTRFTKKSIADATTTTEVILALTAENRAGVDELVDKALAHGGTLSNETDDQGFMYSRSFQDPDGHLWEVLYMNEAEMPGNESDEPTADEAMAQGVI